METRVLSELLNEVVTRITDDGEVVKFYLVGGDSVTMAHYQDCCEEVWLEDTEGDLDDLLGTPITMAEEVTEHTEYENGYESVTWTFYKIGTNRGSVTMRWCGTSNGWYSENITVIRHTAT